MRKIRLFWIYIIIIAANTLVIQLATKLTDERLWTQWILMIPVCMGFIAGILDKYVE